MITKEMIIGDIIRLYPQTLAIFDKFGLDCFECQVADFEKLESSAVVHKVNVDLLLEELNRVIGE
jgi:hybrid cluster-associated redox disulfide protein